MSNQVTQVVIERQLAAWTSLEPHLKALGVQETLWNRINKRISECDNAYAVEQHLVLSCQYLSDIVQFLNGNLKFHGKDIKIIDQVGTTQQIAEEYAIMFLNSEVKDEYKIAEHTSNRCNYDMESLLLAAGMFSQALFPIFMPDKCEAQQARWNDIDSLPGKTRH